MLSMKAIAKEAWRYKVSIQSKMMTITLKHTSPIAPRLVFLAM